MRCGAVDRETVQRKLADRPDKQTDMFSVYKQFFVDGCGRSPAGVTSDRTRCGNIAIW